MESENIPQFCAVTAADPSIAIGYLQVTENNLEQAISLYFANDGQALHTDTGAASSVGAATATGGYDEEEVRAPIAARRDVLVDDYNGSGGMGGAYGSIYSNSTLFRGGASRSAAASSIFNQGAGAGHVPFRDFAQEAAEIAAGESTIMGSESSRRNRLAELFKPPFDIMHSGNIDSARQEAMEDGKWVMINLQEVSDFKCQALNRDIWRQKVIKDIVRQDFVFFQVAIDTAEGVKLATMYGAGEFPFVAVIHPKTGELRRIFARIENVSDMVEDIANFLLDHPGPKKSASAHGSDTGSRAHGSNRRMTEAEELAAAIAASELESNGARSRGSGTTANPIPLGSDSEMDSDYENSDSYSEIISINSDSEADDDDDDDGYGGGQGEMEVDEAPPVPEGPDAWYRQLPTTVPAEPALGPTVTRIQFRFPSGQRVVRRFEKSAKVVAIFHYLKATLPEAASDVPEALFMGARLADIIEQTIDESKLANASITIDV